MTTGACPNGWDKHLYVSTNERVGQKGNVMNGYCENAGVVSYDECDLCNPPCSVCGDRGCHEMYTMGGELICSSCDEWWNCGDSCEDCDEFSCDLCGDNVPDGDGRYNGDSRVCVYCAVVSE